MRLWLGIVLAVLTACVSASDAFAHARLVGSLPRDGAVVARAPDAVRLVFDDAVAPLGGTRAIRNGDGSVLAAPPRRAAGAANVLLVPLRPRLRDGDYTVAWRALSDDGHTITGVLAFGVGAGRAPPVAALEAASGEPGALSVVSRALFLLGVLTAFGACLFDAVVWTPALRRLGRRTEPGHLLALAFAGFLVALLGTLDLSPHHVSAATRAEKLFNAGAAFAAVGAMATAVRFAVPRLRWLPLAVAVVLVPIPALAGHASDTSPVPLSVVADVLHTAAAGIWVGGVLALALAVPVLARTLEPERRGTFQEQAFRRFSAMALPAVLVIGATGVVRALRELDSVDQLWSTGYGQVILVKTALFAVLLALGWRNRSRLIPRLPAPASVAALVTTVRAEGALLVALVAAVGLLTALTPGRERVPSARAAEDGTTSGLRLPPPPPKDAVVLAREAGKLAVGLALRPRPDSLDLQASVLDSSGSGLSGASTEFTAEDAGASASAAGNACGPGCYRASLPVGRPRRVTLRLEDGGAPTTVVRFALPARWPKTAPGDLERASAAFRRLRSLRVRERLASSPTNALNTTYDVAAPDRLRYRIDGRGEAILIGKRRWDREPGGRWTLSPQTPIRQPTTTWGRHPTNAHLLRCDRRTETIAFFDPGLPAWFTLTVDRRSYRPRELRMTAAAHFMRHTYSRLNRPVSIVPPA